MLNVETIKNGLVIDHICAGYGPKIFNWLGLANARFTAALVMNVQSKKGGKKDIIKIDNIINIDYSVLGFIDPNSAKSDRRNPLQKSPLHHSERKIHSAKLPLG